MRAVSSSWSKAAATAVGVYVAYAIIFMSLDVARVGTSLPTHPKLLFYVWASAFVQYLIVLVPVFAIAALISLIRRGHSYSRALTVSVYVAIPLLAILLYGSWYASSS
jgi:hypothetical protein